MTDKEITSDTIIGLNSPIASKIAQLKQLYLLTGDIDLKELIAAKINELCTLKEDINER